VPTSRRHRPTGASISRVRSVTEEHDVSDPIRPRQGYECYRYQKPSSCGSSAEVIKAPERDPPRLEISRAPGPRSDEGLWSGPRCLGDDREVVGPCPRFRGREESSPPHDARDLPVDSAVTVMVLRWSR
jgi:hypothetical protein